MKQNKKIAITGGIGSGKTTAADIIKKMGYSVLSCDEIYADMLKEKDFSDIICGYFPDARSNDGSLDRKKLSGIVFGNAEKLDLLNRITNPPIMERAEKNMEKVNGAVFCEVPLLFENRYEVLFDEVIVVLRDRAKRIESVQKRSSLTMDEVILRMSSQTDYDTHDFSMYYVIHNNTDFDNLRRETARVLEEMGL